MVDGVCSVYRCNRLTRPYHPKARAKIRTRPCPKQRNETPTQTDTRSRNQYPVCRTNRVGESPRRSRQRRLPLLFASAKTPCGLKLNPTAPSRCQGFPVTLVIQRERHLSPPP